MHAVRRGQRHDDAERRADPQQGPDEEVRVRRYDVTGVRLRQAAAPAERRRHGGRPAQRDLHHLPRYVSLCVNFYIEVKN